ncbi:MAG: hypothetical protein ACRDLL_13010 [Solirubrobacterales bacterium]
MALGDVPYSDLAELENAELMDKIIRAVAKATDGDYVAAFDALRGYAVAAGAANPRGQVTLADVIEYSPLSMRRVERDVGAITAELTRADERITNADDLPPAPFGVLGPDGYLSLADAEPDAIARMLEDPVEREARYQRARRADNSYAGTEGRERFLADDRAYADADRDLVGTLELQARQQEIVRRRTLASNQRTAADRRRQVRQDEERRRQQRG